MDSDSIYLIIIIISVLLSGYFSATETAFSSLNRIRVKNLAEKGNKRAKLVLKLSEQYDVLISTILIGNNIVNILAASLGTLLFVELLGQDIGATVSTVVMTIVVLIFAEVSPKTIAKESPEKFAMFSAPYIHILISVFAPFNLFFKGWKKLLSKVFKSSDERSITEEELLTIIDEAEEGGGINETEGTLIRSAIEFTELEAADILTPRTDVTFISMDMEKEKIAKTFAETGYSRLPVYEGTHDHVVGIIHHKDFHNFIYHTDVMLSEYVKPALFITKAKKIDALLKELQLKKMHIAVVLDEFGGTVGIVTMEDILEELVGEIWDEHDEVIHEIEKIGEKHYLVSGHANVEKFFEMIDYDMETDVFTVSGWVVETIGHLPKKGETYSNSTFEIEIREIDGKRIKKVAIKDIRIIKENDND
ncbi:MAG: hemolysin family protein [Acholeplasma sp.]|jgi:CBS domain containing-hemolysin-like protein|nr:hemolysin family protein [Acholeplasma sp.]